MEMMKTMIKTIQTSILLVTPLIMLKIDQKYL